MTNLRDGLASGGLRLSDNLAVTGDLTLSGHKNSKIRLFNTFLTTTGSGSGNAAGYLFPFGSTNAKANIPLSGLVVGEELTGYRLLGKLVDQGTSVAVSGTVSAVMYSVSGTVQSAITGGSITATSGTTDTSFDVANSSAMSETVAANTTYLVEVNYLNTSGSVDCYVNGLELDCNLK